ncbi:PEP-CTERM sorting domain-containing protein [Crocosphaera watsonii]|uniref:PEP-CTERM protein-sorting domain-containing protein n=1 Tax=Crocosphaera watsonii WH 8502 TaxID=423474 RepID=T2I7N5_CROWT|nr:PEP-CTERM sorting domain-containing protein [Crocosphaera watsonii]CCQ49461.1 hypothetical protein CWATWH8502_1173 [Crocosphaera watsonii WH 8502]
MYKTLLTATLALGITGMTALSTKASTLVFADNFNQENNGVRALNYSSFNNWDVTNGSVDLYGRASNGFGSLLVRTNGAFVDLDGSTGTAGTLTSKQTFTFNPGDILTLQYDLSPGARPNTSFGNNILIVSLGDIYRTVHATGVGFPLKTPFKSFSTTIHVTERTRGNLVFSHLGGDTQGIYLDNVRLSVEKAVVPEPLTILGAGTAIAFGAGFKRKLGKANKK